MKTFVILFFVLVVSAVSPFIKVDTSSQHFIDSDHRVRVFHGVNVVYKAAPFYPPIDDRFDSNSSLAQIDVDNLKKWGFNVVRLYVAWEGVEPQRGQYNLTYIEKLLNITKFLRDNDIYVILDAHQDLINQQFCGEGFPDWAVPYNISTNSFPIPLPITVPRDDKGYPLRSECLKHAFFQYYFAYSVGESFQHFYDNVNGVRTSFAQMWGLIASKFSNMTNLLGYEILNEPWAGNIYHNPLLLLDRGLADHVNLVPLNQEVHKHIRQYDDQHILFYEHMVSDINIIGFDQGPGGSSYNDRQALSYHIYCQYLDPKGDPKSRYLCQLFDDSFISWREQKIKQLGGGGFLTEFGALSDSPQGVDEATWICEEADKYIRSWAYWQFKYYADITTQDMPPTGESFYDNDGKLFEHKVKALSRTYAHAICGRPKSMKFNTKTSDFELVYSTVDCNQKPTVIYLNEQMYYENGFVVDIIPSGAANYTRVSVNYLNFLHMNITLGADITIRVHRK